MYKILMVMLFMLFCSCSKNRHFEDLLTSAKDGEIAAQLQLGLTYFEQQPPQVKQGVYWLKQAAAQGNAEAEYNLGVFYFKRGGENNYVLAKEYFEQAAKLGSLEAYYSLGVMFHDGLGVTQDLEQAIQYYLKAAKKGHADAMYNLGVIFAFELDPPNDAKAADWLSRAAKKGQADAFYNLAVMYQSGKGVEQSSKNAKKLFKQACKRGNQPACHQL